MICVSAPGLAPLVIHNETTITESLADEIGRAFTYDHDSSEFHTELRRWGGRRRFLSYAVDRSWLGRALITFSAHRKPPTYSCFGANCGIIPSKADPFVITVSECQTCTSKPAAYRRPSRTKL